MKKFLGCCTTCLFSLFVTQTDAAIMPYDMPVCTYYIIQVDPLDSKTKNDFQHLIPSPGFARMVSLKEGFSWVVIGMPQLNNYSSTKNGITEEKFWISGPSG